MTAEIFLSKMTVLNIQTMLTTRSVRPLQTVQIALSPTIAEIILGSRTPRVERKITTILITREPATREIYQQPPTLRTGQQLQPLQTENIKLMLNLNILQAS
jgi:hypothetical protein